MQAVRLARAVSASRNGDDLTHAAVLAARLACTAAGVISSYRHDRT